MQNLNFNDKIVNPDGTPTEYFMRLLQNRGVGQEDIETRLAALLAKQIIAGDGLDGGGTLGDPGDITIGANASAILDLISTSQGAILYRNATSWGTLAPGASGQYLKTLGAGANPAWDTPSGGGGGSWVNLSLWRFDVDGAIPSRDIDVSAYDEVLVSGNAALTVSGWRNMRVSIDGGVTFLSTAIYQDYTVNGQINLTNNELYPHTTATTAARAFFIRLNHLRDSTIPKTYFAARSAGSGWGAILTNSAITHIRLFPVSGGNFTGAGSYFRVQGRT
jgi:hypothetical protein